MLEIQLPTKAGQDAIAQTVKTVNTNVNTVNANVDTVNTNVDTVKQTVATVNTNVALNATKLGALQSTVNTVNANTAKGAVKSVQRGVATIDQSFASVDIDISPVATNKALFLVNSSDTTVSGSLESSTVLRLTRQNDQQSRTTTVQWQVIEFN